MINAQHVLELKPRSKGFHLVTDEIIQSIGELPKAGVLHLFIQHTSAALAVNENADKTVRQDLDTSFNRLAPEAAEYEHKDEGPDDMPAHIKSVLIGSSVSIPILNGQLAFGTWQGIYLCEFRTHAGGRRLIATVLS